MDYLIVSFLAQILSFNMYHLAAYHITSVYLCGRVSLSELLTLDQEC